MSELGRNDEHGQNKLLTAILLTGFVLLQGQHSLAFASACAEAGYRDFVSEEASVEDMKARVQRLADVVEARTLSPKQKDQANLVCESLTDRFQISDHSMLAHQVKKDTDLPALACKGNDGRQHLLLGVFLSSKIGDVKCNRIAVTVFKPLVVKVFEGEPHFIYDASRTDPYRVKVAAAVQSTAAGGPVIEGHQLYILDLQRFVDSKSTTYSSRMNVIAAPGAARSDENQAYYVNRAILDLIRQSRLPPSKYRLEPDEVPVRWEQVMKLTSEAGHSCEDEANLGCNVAKGLLQNELGFRGPKKSSGVSSPFRVIDALDGSGPSVGWHQVDFGTNEEKAIFVRTEGYKQYQWAFRRIREYSVVQLESFYADFVPNINSRLGEGKDDALLGDVYKNALNDSVRKWSKKKFPPLNIRNEKFVQLALVDFENKWGASPASSAASAAAKAARKLDSEADPQEMVTWIISTFSSNVRAEEQSDLRRRMTDLGQIYFKTQLK